MYRLCSGLLLVGFVVGTLGLGVVGFIGTEFRVVGVPPVFGCFCLLSALGNSVVSCLE